MDDRTIWEMHSGRWLQDDEKRRFLILNPESNEPDTQLGLDITCGAKWHLEGEYPCDGFFPPEFDHCPYCGSKLVSNEYSSNIWVPPYGDGSGLRKVAPCIHVDNIPMQVEQTKRWMDQDGHGFSLPRSRGDYEFIVAPFGTKSSVLVVFDRTSGSIDYFSEAQKKWIPLAPPHGRRFGESRLPNWSWSAAVSSGKAGFAVPTDGGPVWIAIDWRNSTCMPAFGQGSCIGGAATISNQIFIPTLIDSAIAIQCFDFQAFAWRQSASVVGWMSNSSGESRYLSVPVIDEGRSVIYWIEREGLITFDLSMRNCTWRPWETGDLSCRTVPELGPPYQDMVGNFWQICYDDHDEAFRYYKLNGDENDREAVRQGAFSSGISCFSRYYDLWEKPWAKVDEKLHFDKATKLIRAPLLCLDEGESKATITAQFGEGITLPLLKLVDDREKIYAVELHIESRSELSIELKMPKALNIPTPWELRLFIYRQHLYAYSIEGAVCYRWRLEKCDLS